MKGRIVSVGCAAVFVAGVAAAQPHKPDNGRVTVTGCLSVNAAAKAYILTTTPDNVAKTAGAVANRPTTIQYQLVGGNGLQQQVGKTIEVSGTLVPGTEATAKSEAERTDSPRNGQHTDKTPKVETKTEAKIRAQTMRVESFRPVSASCQPAR